MVDIAAALLSSRSFGEEHLHINEFRRPSNSGMFLRVRRKTPAGSQTDPTTPLSKPRRSLPSNHAFLVPSQALKAHWFASEVTTTPKQREAPVTAPVGSEKSNPKQKRRRRRNKKASSTATSTTDSTKSKKPARSGNLPDIYWRSIPLDDLRHHPQFESLPLPETIRKLESLDDIRLFRQESWQWDAVHEGRCTTSQAVAALGFLEPETGRRLGVPRSWQRGGQGAYHRLRKSALRTLEEMNDILCNSNFTMLEETGPLTKDPTVWSNSDREGDDRRDLPFAAKYMRQTTPKDLEERRELSQALSKSPGFDFSVRMMWGNAQEATALLTALNYFWKQDNGVILKEVGMCGGGLKINHTSGATSSLLVGATPDGLLCYPNGTVEALEVKNHCPFFPVQNTNRRGGSRAQRHLGGKRFSIRHLDIEDAGVPSQYIPQLMMEMLCVGENCRSSIMIRQTATSGSLVLRIHRDDQWVEEMLYWLNRFQLDFVEREEPPPQDFFLKGPVAADRERYSKFLEKTLELKSKVEVVAHIPHSDVQRAMAARPGMANLFLD